MPVSETLLGKVRPVLSPNSNKVNIPLPASVCIDWKFSKEHFYAKYFAEDGAISISPFAESGYLSYSTAKYVSKSNSISLDADILKEIGSFTEDGSFDCELGIFRCCEKKLLFEVKIRRHNVQDKISFYFYNDFSEQEVTKLMEKYPEMDINIKVFEHIDCLQLRVFDPS